MKRLPLVLLCLWAAAGIHVLADQVTLNNGDRVTGDIVQADAHTLTLRTESMGTITIAMTAVAGVTSAEPLYLDLDGGVTVTGPVVMDDSELWVSTSAAGPVAVPRESVQVIRSRARQEAYLAEIERYHDPGLLDLWSGYVEAGFSLASGNSNTLTFSTGLNANRRTPHDVTSVYVQSLYSTSGTPAASSTTAKSLRGGGRYEVLLNNRMTAFGYGDVEHDEFQELDLRLAPGAGLGYYVVKNRDTQWQIFSGINLNQEFFYTDPDRTSGEVKLGQDLSTRITDRLGIQQHFALFPNLTDCGTYRFVFDTSAVATLNKWLAWHITLNDRYVSNPVDGAERNDVLLTTGLRVSFQR
jgi:putative salt-induced outer membrane protein YdiY